MSARPSVVVTYSSKDKIAMQDLLVHLVPLARREGGVIDLFVDEKIPKGENWGEVIAREIGEAKIAILLVSANYLASEYVCDKELPYILSRAHKGELKVLSVFLAAAATEIGISFTDSNGKIRTARVDQFQGFGTPEKPLSKMTQIECQDVFVALERRVRELAATAGPTTLPLDDSASGVPEPGDQRGSQGDGGGGSARRGWPRSYVWGGVGVAAAMLAALVVWSVVVYRAQDSDHTLPVAAHMPGEAEPRQSSPPPVESCELSISSPAAGAPVGAGVLVTGRAKVPAAGHVWILLHPSLFGLGWWPQDPVSFGGDGKAWSTLAHVGNENNIGLAFEIAAVVVTGAEHARFEAWLDKGRATGDFPSLSYPLDRERLSGCPVVRRTVTKVSH
jgi:hypothetical protein